MSSLPPRRSFAGSIEEKCHETCVAKHNLSIS
eukprot:CAMPEP_0184750132 /NCGR_PEP_ID=MMETSP0315-20130426/33563_1 /TAXON_ID=101924 /ORGANISM="Rhodosorus marinus, Strain UTEX LB 2760" /LENGTH=31 /DNA_ID= /DNA_START= /DNA_END= /DNA_ORIENTATION=